MRVVIDCNVLVSAARSGGVCGKVIIEAMRNHGVVLSEPIVDEYGAIAGRLAHARYRDGLLAIIAELEQVAVFVEPADVAFGLRDPDDEIYLATATARRRGPDHGQQTGLHGAAIRVGGDFLPTCFSGSNDMTCRLTAHTETRHAASAIFGRAVFSFSTAAKSTSICSMSRPRYEHADRPG